MRTRAASEEQYVIWHNGKNIGPVSIHDLQELLSNRKISLATRIREFGSKNWFELRELSQMREIRNKSNTPTPRWKTAGVAASVIASTILVAFVLIQFNAQQPGEYDVKPDDPVIVLQDHDSEKSKPEDSVRKEQSVIQQLAAQTNPFDILAQQIATAHSNNEDTPYNQAAWNDFLGLLEKKQVELQQLRIKKEFYVTAINQGVASIADTQVSDQSVHVVVGRPRFNEGWLQQEYENWEFNQLYQLIDGNFLSGNFLTEALQQQTPIPKRSAGWIRRGIDVNDQQFDSLHVGSTVTLELQGEEIIRLYRDPPGYDGHLFHSVAEMAFAGGKSNANKTMHSEWLRRFGFSPGMFLVTASIVSEENSTDDFGRENGTIADLLTNSRPTSDEVCFALANWTSIVQDDQALLQTQLNSCLRYSTAESQNKLSKLMTNSKAALDALQKELTPFLIWINEDELLELLWQDVLTYDAKTLIRETEKPDWQKWDFAKERLTEHAAILAICGDSDRTFNLLTDNLFDPFRPLASSKSGTTLSHIAYMLGSQDCLDELTQQRYVDEIINRIAVVQAEFDRDQGPFSEGALFDKWSFDVRPMWLRRQRPADDAIAEVRGIGQLDQENDFYDLGHTHEPEKWTLRSGEGMVLLKLPQQTVGIVPILARDVTLVSSGKLPKEPVDFVRKVSRTIFFVSTWDNANEQVLPYSFAANGEVLAHDALGELIRNLEFDVSIEYSEALNKLNETVTTLKLEVAKQTAMKTRMKDPISKLKNRLKRLFEQNAKTNDSSRQTSNRRRNRSRRGR